MCSLYMSQIHRIGSTHICKRELFSVFLLDFASMPEPVPLPSNHFVAFLAADATGVETAVLVEFVRKLLNAGCVYFCVWGPGCERLHDIFDEVCFEVEPVIMTTWHSDESLDEALWFFVWNAHPDDGYVETTKSALAISVSRIDWETQIKRRLANLDSLNRDVVEGH